ncbi:hypothetical protein Pcac1_g17783 [Phytophthora cactorum]|nr:hypothetical protein Pcac1_g17783 [Phytophthora cactorum]
MAPWLGCCSDESTTDVVDSTAAAAAPTHDLNSKYTKGDIAPGEMLFSKKYLNEQHGSFNEVCHLFLNEAKLVDEIPAACVLACAGPILKNTVDFTNVEFGWKIDGSSLEKELGIKTVRLINDFAAMGYGLLTLRPHEYMVLNDAPRTRPLLWPPSALVPDWQAFLSVERIVSGPGLATIYEFLAKKFPEKVDPKVHEEFLKANTQQGKVIGENAKTNELCNQTLEIFVGAYGREAGNAMLKYLPRGGFYITGGLAPKNLDYFTKKDIFLNSVFDKGRVSPAIKACPIYLVLTEELGERGAHFFAYQLLGQ